MWEKIILPAISPRFTRILVRIRVNRGEMDYFWLKIISMELKDSILTNNPL
jgi:hypothetical protein